MMTCAWERLRKFRFAASVFLETDDDMCPGRTGEILGKLGFIASVFFGSDDDMCVGKTAET